MGPLGAENNGNQKRRLVLVAARLSAAASHLELATSRPNARAGGRVRNAGSLAHVLLGRASFNRPAEQNSALSQRSLQSQLVEGEALTSRLHDASPGGLSELERAYAHLRHLQFANVVRNAPDDDRDLPLLAELDELPQRQWSPEATHHHQPLQDHFVELRSRAAAEELVQLDEQRDVRVGAQRLLARRGGLAPTRFQIDTHDCA